MLILFDIDATLITSARAGVRAMLDAGRELHGERFSGEGVSFAGGLDPSLIALMLERSGVDSGRESVETFRAAYGRRLRRLLDAKPGTCIALPGVHEMLSAAHAAADRGEAIIGLLTGNYPETGEMKLADAGIDVSRFTVRVWGCDSPIDPPKREHLPAVAHARCLETLGREIGGDRTVVVGDTPHDVACALAHGCRALGVATGQYTTDDLRTAGAHHVAPSLRDTEALMRWMLNGER